MLDGCVPTASGETASLVVPLLGELMRNGGAFVCSGEVAHRLADAGSRLVGGGLVVDVRDAGEEAGPVHVRPASGDAAPVLIPQDSPPELVGEIVCRRLEQWGYLTGPWSGTDPHVRSSGTSAAPTQSR